MIRPFFAHLWTFRGQHAAHNQEENNTMSTYAIGDIQGCYSSFLELLTLIDFNAGKDTLWLAGDVVNRGTDSLAMLRWVQQHADCTQMILGNHDLHLIAVDAGASTLKRGDTTQAILAAPDKASLMSFLRAQPLFHLGQMPEQQPYAMVHAGLLPEWDLALAGQLAAEVSAALQDARAFPTFIRDLFGNTPTRWSDELQGMDKMRLTVNVMTRMRALTRSGELALAYKGAVADMPLFLQPWFKAPNRRHTDRTLIVGHWSALGLHQADDIVALDTGCLWGGSLSALNLNTREVTSLPCAATSLL
jgi:bis(5'-nucleosyl)-tetraphosphatase (symmetrical)